MQISNSRSEEIIKNSEYFMKAQKLNRRQACQVLYLLRFILKHVSETKLGKADKLSRRSDWKLGVEKDNKNQILIKEQWICNLVEVVIKGLEVEILEKMKIARERDEEVVRVIEEMKKAKLKVLRDNEWQMEGDLVQKEGKCQDR